MALATKITEREYLHSSYRPDCDYIDGIVVERNLGQFNHALLQTLLAALFVINRKNWGVIGLVEQRLLVGSGKYRILDMLALPSSYDRSPVVNQAPLLCIEIVSPDDRLSDLTARAKDYLDLGVPETWIFDPDAKKAFIYSSDGLHEVSPTILRCGNIEIDIAALFAQID